MVKQGKRLAAGALAVFMAAVCAACGNAGGDTTAPSAGEAAPQSEAAQPAEQGDTSQVIIAISSEPESGFDPCVGWGHGVTPLFQSTLVEYTQEMEIESDLATGYEISADGLTWSFTLREDAFFTDGEQVTAADVAFTFTTAKNAQSSLDLTVLDRCEATGDFTVDFVLTKPTSTFINTVATIGIVPEHAYGSDYAVNPMGSGPWIFVQWNKGEQVIMTANEDYYGSVPAIKKAVILFMDEDAAFAAAQAGAVDVALVSATNAARDIPDMRLERVTTLDNRGLTLPVEPAGSGASESGQPAGNDVTADLAIRQALAYGIDRERIAREALGGFATPAYSENDGMPWNNPAVKIETDTEKARRLLADGGWADSDGDGILEKDGLIAAFTCIYPSGDTVRQAVAMAASAQARELGIRIEVEGTGWDEISKRMFSDAVLMGWGSSNPYTSYLLYHSQNRLRDDYYNPEGFGNATVDGYLDQALHAPTAEEANVLWQKAQWDGATGTAMQGECPWVWLVNVEHLYYVRTGLSIGRQQLHAHGASWTLLQNLRDWSWIG